jgi:methionyl-tRNA formyltransferase
MLVALLVAGPKGANFLAHFRGDAAVASVVSYPSKGLQIDAHAEIADICRAKGYSLLAREKLRPDDYAAADLVLLIGWQWMTKEVDRRFVVFHDSLLPRLRGFNPTVTALIAGDTEIGVTAFSPSGGDTALADSGPVFGQEKISVDYPVTIRTIYEELGLAYCRLADRVLEAAAAGTLSFAEQDAKNATYSLWRGEDDYQIDWTMSAEQIRRFVDAVGWPYMCAKCTMEGREIRIGRVEALPDLAFVNRCPGKIWSLADGVPKVVCGSGMLRILQARETDGSPVKFTSLRVRLGN